jgi:hypothetical protein
MSIASKVELENAITAAVSDLKASEARMNRGNDDYLRGYVDALKHAQDVLGVSVKKYRIGRSTQ